MSEKIMSSQILIVGTGLVGLSAALALSQAGFSVHTLERHVPTGATRPISLSYGSVCFLQKLGIWPSLTKAASPILSVHVSEQGKFGFTKFDASAEKVPALGYVVPYDLLEKTLYEQVKNITPIDDITNITIHEKNIHVATKKQNFSADLLLAADGTYSLCRDFLKIPYDETDTDHDANIYQLTLLEPHTNTAYERFTAKGTFAILPLSDKKTAQLVWTKKKTEHNDTEILPEIKTIFEGRLEIKDCMKIASYPLKTVIAQTQIAPHAFLLGNAAHTIYPLAAQGFNLGLHDIQILIKTLLKAKKEHRFIYDNDVLTQYQNTVLTQQKAIFNITSTLTSLFDFPGLGCMRGLGLFATDLLTPIKQRLAAVTMGRTR